MIDDVPVNTEYFGLKGYKDIIVDLKAYVENYYRYLESTGRYAIWRNAYRTYFKGYYTKSIITREGEQSEYRRLNVNHYRNIIQHLKVLITSSRPQWQARAVNTDYKSQCQTILAQNILDYYSREKKLERYMLDCLETALVFGEGWMMTEWDSSLGEDYAAVDGQAMKSGDIRFKVFPPSMVVRDCNQLSVDECDWFIVTRLENKFNLAAKYPQFRDEIIAKSMDVYDRYFKMNLYLDQKYMHSDLIQVYTFLHKKTPVLPNGRMTEFLDSQTCLFDSDLPYDNFPLINIMPEKQHLVPFGYTIGFDILPIQQASDNLYSSIYTNIQTFAIQNIITEKNSGITASDISEGMRFLEINPGSNPPVPLNLISNPPEVYQFTQMVEKLIETISGVNSVARGNPESNVKSGNAMALIQSMAVQFNSTAQNSYSQFREETGTNIISITKQYAKSPRIAVIVGKTQRQYMKEYTGEDISNVNRVIVDEGNAMMRTLAGKDEVAQRLLNAGLIRNPEEYLQIINTGKLEPLIEGETSELMLIREENEVLRDGKPVITLASDVHDLHIREHRVVTSDQDARADANVTKVTFDHIMEHLNLMRTVDPDLLAIMKEPSLQPPPAMIAPSQPKAPGGEKLPGLPNLPSNLQDEGARAAYAKTKADKGNTTANVGK